MVNELHPHLPNVLASLGPTFFPACGPLAIASRSGSSSRAASRHQHHLDPFQNPKRDGRPHPCRRGRSDRRVLSGRESAAASADSARHGPLAPQRRVSRRRINRSPFVIRISSFGSIGNGHATLTINGVPVAVAPNGTFLGFLAGPAADRAALRACRASRAPTARARGSRARSSGPPRSRDDRSARHRFGERRRRAAAR